MPDLLMWTCEGSFASIGTNLFLATQLKNSGVDVVILFDGEALAAIAENNVGYEPTPLLKKHAETIEQNLKKMGMPSEPEEVLKIAVAAKVPLYACAGWAGFLDVAQKLPADIKLLEIPDVVKLIADSKRISGGF